MVEMIKHFEVYLKGVAFTVETDHRALEFIITMKRGSPKLMRWAALLQEHHCTLVYRPGETNSVADALSRAFEEDCQGDPHYQTLQHTGPAKSPEEGGDVGTSPSVTQDRPRLVGGARGGARTQRKRPKAKRTLVNNAQAKKDLDRK